MALALRVRTPFTWRDPESSERTEFVMGSLIGDPALVVAIQASEQRHFVHRTLLPEDHDAVLPYLPDDHPAMVRYMKAVVEGQDPQQVAEAKALDDANAKSRKKSDVAAGEGPLPNPNP